MTSPNILVIDRDAKLLRGVEFALLNVGGVRTALNVEKGLKVLDTILGRGR